MPTPSRSTTALDARQAAAFLLNLRSMIVAPFGLKTSGAGDRTKQGMIGIFPILWRKAGALGSSTSTTAIWIFASSSTSRPQLRAAKLITTTLVKTHNLIGRIYLATILPFHRLILRNMLQRVVASAL